MERKEYSAGAVKMSFWFIEFRKVVQLLHDGKSMDEIKELAHSENIFAAPTALRSNQIYSTVAGRIRSLDQSFIPYFLTGDLATQKLYALIAAMAYDTLFFDFVYEVIREKMIVGSNELAKTTLFQILAGELEPDEGTYKWGITTSQAYFPKDPAAEFDNDDTIADWLTGYSPVKDATYVRGFLGRMLFAGEDGVKKVKVLSGGEKVRCLLSKMMISGANCLILDEPTNHLDMESITALNNGLIKFPGVALFACHDHQFVQTTANRIMEILPDGSLIDKITTYDEYLESDEMARKRTVYTADREGDED